MPLNSRRPPQTVLITGASSGIGRALALAYAAPGSRLILIGRNAERLAATAQKAMDQGAEVIIGAIDVRDQAAMAAWISERDKTHPIDLAIANAGITTGLSPGELTEDPQAVRAILATNLLGVLNTIEPLIQPMSARGKGQIACIGSIAGLHGLPYAPAYCMTKSAVHAYMESIRGRLEARGLVVSLIIPGFVKTPLNDSIDALKPLEISDSKAAALIRRGLERGKAIIAFPLPLYWLARFGRLLPPRLYDRIMAGVAAQVPQTQERV
ncbi:SDR family NAD(P)-dependent oxidoreductase [Beijerinckia indica]|uniref:Short-chain dehydrogenase/reductase SDR n=1 Tax=Beijerinckia indica subsp. indica (strain ATCC 9039 / DSM 1715 / NCIMB 8712) TaxID=395963 RepID=B2ID83_BEII9|nr:SDR family NAD(P)-dependent oxidoreductase [Beijerinckia indica]ACB93940.1 short-chain dehydrogenase/reductase SDR [Beijerinckia indica subsp. indica ATCC 9039]